MSQTVRCLLAAAGLAASALLATALPAGLATPALAQEPAPKVNLTQKQIDGMIAAQPEIQAAESKSASDKSASDKPDPALQAKLEAIARKHGFSGLDEYGRVSESVAIVIVGVDPEKRTYVGPAAMIKQQMAELEADKAMKPAEKAAALEEARQALAGAEARPPSAENIALVTKNFGKLVQAIADRDDRK